MVTGGIGYVTQQNRDIKIAGEQRDRNCKIGEGGGLACEKLEKNSRRIRRISQHHFVILSGKKQMLEHTQRMQFLQLQIKKIQHDPDDMHDMAAMVQCNLSNLIGVGTPDKQLLGSSYFTTPHIKCCLTWHKHGIGDLRQN